jgi:hypothetical protein
MLVGSSEVGGHLPSPQDWTIIVVHCYVRRYNEYIILLLLLVTRRRTEERGTAHPAGAMYPSREIPTGDWREAFRRNLSAAEGDSDLFVK